MANRHLTQNRAAAQGLAHPIELVTHFVARHEWQVRERERDAVLAEVPGRWSDYQLAVVWRGDDETMQVTCRIDVHGDQTQLGELALLAALLNQDAHIGHLALDLNACELELRRDRQDRVHLLEINPRFPAWCDLTTHAGCPLPTAAVALAMGRTPPQCPPAKAGVAFVRATLDQFCDMGDLESLTMHGHRTAP